MKTGLKVKSTKFLNRYRIRSVVNSNNCWLYQGYKVSGYGRVTYKGKQWLLHRLSFLLFYGHLSDELIVGHKCDTPSCFNPRHLWLGTKQENTIDSVQKGRHVDNTGVKNGRAKLTQQKANDIRRRRELGASTKELSENFGVSIATIQRVLTLKNWKDNG